MSLDQRREMVCHWWTKAEESLASAKRELDAGSYGFAMNRVYYAAFYAVSAALLDRNLAFKKHAGVRATFHREFIKANLLDPDWGKFYDRVFEDRQEADYIALISFDKEYATNQLGQCHAFLAQLRPLISSLPQK